MSKDYERCLEKYVDLLEKSEEYSTALGLVTRYVEPQFGDDTFLDVRDLRQLIKSIPEKELELTSTTSLYEIIQEGLTKYEIEDCRKRVVELDKERKNLHEELKKLGRKEGYDDADVMADIVFKHYNWYDKSSLRLHKDRKKIVLNGGMLLLGFYDCEGHTTVGEYNFNEKVNPNSYSYQWFVESKEAAKRIFNRYVREGANGADYRGKLFRKYKKEEIESVFQKIKNDNPDIPITIDFELSHSAHGVVVFAHNLKADFSRFGVGEIEAKLIGFMQDVEPYVNFLRL